MEREYQEPEHLVDDVHARRLRQIARLRMLVGFLGEKAQYNWWVSEFFSTPAPAFLDPVFSKTRVLAQYHGIREAARRIHDEHIGVGRVFHLFRLPEAIEQAIFEIFQDSIVAETLIKEVTSQEAVAAALHEIADSSAPLREGPVQIGSVGDLDSADWLSIAAGCYEAAFNSGAQSFPYLTNDA